MPVRESAQRSVAAFGAVASSAAHALRPHNALLRRVQDLVQHLTDGAVLSVERIRVHLESLLPVTLRLLFTTLFEQKGDSGFNRCLKVLRTLSTHSSRTEQIKDAVP